MLNPLKSGDVGSFISLRVLLGFLKVFFTYNQVFLQCTGTSMVFSSVFSQMQNPVEPRKNNVGLFQLVTRGTRTAELVVRFLLLTACGSAPEQDWTPSCSLCTEPLRYVQWKRLTWMSVKGHGHCDLICPILVNVISQEAPSGNNFTAAVLVQDRPALASLYRCLPSVCDLAGWYRYCLTGPDASSVTQSVAQLTRAHINNDVLTLRTLITDIKAGTFVCCVAISFLKLF